MDWGKKWVVDFNAGKTKLVLFDWCNNTGSIDMKMNGSVLEEKSSFKIFKLYRGSYIISIAQTASKKIGALIFSVKFLSTEVALYLYKSTICPFMEHCCHIWTGVPSCYLELLDKLQKQICRTVGPSLAASLEPLAHCWNMASLSPFSRYFFGRCSSALAQLFPLPFSKGGLLVRCYKDVNVNSLFPCTARLWNFVPVECFPLTYNLNGFKSRINRQL